MPVPKAWLFLSVKMEKARDVVYKRLFKAGSGLIKYPLQETRIFSLRGCHLLAMFARTPVAKEFRRWVLDVLETWETARAHQLHLPSAALTPFLPAPLPLSPFPRLRTLPKARRQELNDLVLAKLAHVPPLLL